jgi:hypothetical protein
MQRSEVHPHVEYIRLAQVDLKTHMSVSLYEIFLPTEARRILQREEFHYTRHPRELVEDVRHPGAQCLSQHADREAAS